VPGGVATSVTLATQAASAIPIIIRRCVEEVERRGLDIIGRVDKKSPAFSSFVFTDNRCHVTRIHHLTTPSLNENI
jgi:hypothetical protein